MSLDYYDPRKVGELFLEDPARIAKAAPALQPAPPRARRSTLGG